MKKYKLVCLDIDGTLLNSQHQITEKTKFIINKITKEKNIPVVLVSARMPKGILFLQKELGINEPIICYSGSLILDNNHNVLMKKYIEASHVRSILNIIKNEDIHASLYKDNVWYIKEMDKWAFQEKEITNIMPQINKYEELLEHWEEENSGCNKILCMGDPNKIESLKDKLNNILGSSLNIYLSKPTYLEIMPKDSSKTLAIEVLLRKYCINKSELIAIGDNYNDVDMIKYAGMGIAMGNAPEEVKRIADDITLSNDEDGVAFAINKYVID